MLGELIKAGGSLLGGLFGKKSTDKANEQNIKLQREFAQNGVQWKVADARKAGISPLAALGASTASFSPSVVGDTGMANSLSDMGQDIGRAVNATATNDTRNAAMQATLAQETLKGLRLDNEGKAIQNAALASATVRNAQVGAAFPAADGSTNTGIAGQASPLKIGGIPVPTDPSTSAASKFSDEFGEIGENAAGLIKLNRASTQLTPNQAAALGTAILGPAFSFTWKKPTWYNPAKRRDYGKPYKGNDVFQ